MKGNIFYTVWAYHVPYFLKRFNNIKKFNMERIENRNYTNKIAYFGATSRGTNIEPNKQVLNKNFSNKTKYLFSANKPKITCAREVFVL